MAITYVGNLGYQAVLAQTSADTTKFDPLYAPYALKTFPFDGNTGLYGTPEAGTFTGFNPITPAVPSYDEWIHLRVQREGSWGGNGSSQQAVMQAINHDGNVMFAIWRGSNASNVFLELADDFGTRTQMMGYFPLNYTVTLDFHLVQDGVNWTLEVYVDGIHQITLTKAIVTKSPLRRFVISPAGELGNVGTMFWYMSEIVMADGEPTLGCRLATLRARGLNTINTFTSENPQWASLGDENMITGVSTGVAGSRIAGGYETYSGTNMPVGIRGMVQALRYIENDSGLVPSTFLRHNGVNNDNVSLELRDQSRVIGTWDVNPFTGAEWLTTDMNTIDGGVRSIIRPAT